MTANSGRIAALLAFVLSAACAIPAAPAAAEEAGEAAKGPAGSAPASADPQAVIAKAAAYEFGQSRKPLVAAEKVIRESAGKPKVRAAARQALVKLLGSQATRAAKAWACRQLRIVGQAEDVPALAELLGDKELSHMARTALEAIPAETAAQALRDALPRLSGPALIGVINSLGTRCDAKAVGALAKLAGHADRGVARAAILALGDIAGSEAQAALEKAAAEAPPELKLAIIDARLKIAESLAAAGEKQAAVAIYESLFQEGRPPQVRAAALAGLVAAKGAESAPVLLKLLGGDDPHMQRLAAGHVRSLAGREALRALAAALPKLPPSGQVALLGALAARPDAAGQADAVRAAAEAARSKQPALRLAALKALAALGDASVVALLAEAAAGADKAAADAARTSLYRLRGADVNPRIAARLKGASAAVRVELIRALGARRARSAQAALLDAAQGEHDAAAAEAMKALTDLADEQALPALLKLMAATRKAERRDLAARVVQAVCRRISDEDQAAAPLLAALPKAAPAVKVSLLRVLGRIGGAKALSAVRAAAGEADETVRDAAVRALAAWEGPQAMDDLLRIARESANRTHRVLALRGFVRLIGAAVRPAAQTVELYKAAMAAARRPAEKKLILGSLGGRDDPASLRLACEVLADKDVQAEAAAAALKIASACSGSFPKEVRAAMDKLVAAVDDDALRKRARAIVEETKGQLRVAVNLAGQGEATSPDGVEKDGAASGDAAAIDGKPATYWDEADNRKLYRLVVTFSQPRAVSGVSVLGYRHHDFAPRDFEVLCDGKAVSTVRGAKYDANLLVVVFAETQCKSLELKITGYYGRSPAIRELGIFGRKAVGMTPAQLKQQKRRKVKQLPNGAWIVR